MERQQEEPVRLAAGGTQATIWPGRGGWVSSVRLGGTEVLFVHPVAPPGDLPGGIPVLYPICGRPPAGSRWPFHGFAWRERWSVEERRGDAVVCGLEGADGSRLRLRAEVAEGRFGLALTVENRSGGPLRVQAGFHPYFAEVAEVTVCEPGRRWRYAPDYVHVLPTPEAAPEMPVVAGSPLVRDLLVEGAEAVLRRRDGRRLRLRAMGETLPFLQFYGTPEGRFVCVEPWSAPAGATGEGARIPAGVVERGGRRRFGVVVEEEKEGGEEGETGDF